MINHEENLDDDRKVILRGEVFLYHPKAPFVPSGRSVFGALEYSETADKVRCHECGEWHRSLSSHLATHSLTAREYKDKHGLLRSAALWTPGLTARMSANMRKRRASGQCHGWLPPANARLSLKGRVRAEVRNENNTCAAQILARVKALGDRLGRTPVESELRKDGLHLNSVFFALNIGKISELMSLAGMISPGRAKPKYNSALLVELLRSFYVKHGRVPIRRDYSFGMLPTRKVFVREFGSLDAALDAAGLLYAKHTIHGKHTRDSLAQSLKDFSCLYSKLPGKNDFKSKLLPSGAVFIYHFGSMAAAYAAAGLSRAFMPAEGAA